MVGSFTISQEQPVLHFVHQGHDQALLDIDHTQLLSPEFPSLLSSLTSSGRFVQAAAVGASLASQHAPRLPPPYPLGTKKMRHKKDELSWSQPR